MDWTFSVAVLLSFGAGLLTYKGISGERRDGTLALVLANPISRGTVLMGKYLAALLALTVALLISMLCGMILLRVSGVVQLGADDWVKIGLFGLLSIVFLSAFVLAGLFCSVVARTPLLSAVAFLFIWIGMVFVIPSLGGVLAGRFGSVMTPLQVRETDRAIPEKFTLSPAMSAEEVASTKLRRESAREQLLLEYLQSLVAQVQLGQDLTRISPVSVFSYAAERIVGGGTFRLMQFVHNAMRYREAFFQAIIETDKRDPRSRHRYVPWWCGGDHFSQLKADPGPAKEFLDTIPSSDQGLAAALWDIFLLILYNALAFAATFWRFARQDVAQVPGT